MKLDSSHDNKSITNLLRKKRKSIDSLGLVENNNTSNSVTFKENNEE